MFLHSDVLWHPEYDYWRIKRLQRAYRTLYSYESDFAKLIHMMYDKKGMLIVYVNSSRLQNEPLSFDLIIERIWSLENEHSTQIVWNDDI